MVVNKTFQPLQTITIRASSQLLRFRFVGFNGALCLDNQKALGVTVSDWEQGKLASVIVSGTVLVEASGTINVGDKVTSDAEGKAKQAGAGAEINGRALTNASSGDLVKIILVQ